VAEPNPASVQPSLFGDAHAGPSVRQILAAARARRTGPPAPSHHRCPSPGCNIHVPMRRLACSDHWFALPAELRDAINSTPRRDRRRQLELYREAVRLLHSYGREDHPDART
jgi:hypothetical protein